MIVIPIVVFVLGAIPTGLEKEMEKLDISGRIETIQTTVEIGQYTQKSPGDLRRLAVTQTFVKTTG